MRSRRMRDVEHIYMNVPRWTGRTIEEGTPWMEAAAEVESALAQLDSLLGEFGGIGFSSQMGTLNSVTDGIDAMRDARKYLHEEIVRLVDRPLEECFTRAVNALAAIDFDEIRVENKAGLVVNHAEVGGQSATSRNKEYYSLSDVLKGNVPELNKCVGYHQKIYGFREILEEMGGFTLGELQKKDSGTDDEKPKDEKGFWEKLGDSIDNFLTYHDYGRADDPTGNPPLKSVFEYVGNITIDIFERNKDKSDILERIYKPDGLTDIHRKKDNLENIHIKQNNEKTETYYIDKYVNIETLKAINDRWDIDTLKATYGEDCLERLKECMYECEITDETSILMFLCTIGVESGYGAYILEDRDEDDFNDIKYYSFYTKGAGFIQVTGASQIDFLFYEKELLIENGDMDKLDELQKYLDGFYKNGNIVENKYNVAQYIADNYAIEASTWFWAENTNNAAIIVDEKIIPVSINMYINDVGAVNKDNLFLVTQLFVNGTQNWYFYSLKDMATLEEKIKVEDGKIFFKDGSKAPNNWEERSSDWSRALNLMEGVLD